MVVALQAYGNGDPELSVIFNNLAVLLKSQGHYGEAVALYRQALVIFEHSLPARHPKILTCRKNYNVLQLKVCFLTTIS